jgi:hypothetical protein
MSRSAVRASVARALALLALASPLAAQRAATFGVTPYAGYMISGKALQGPLGTDVSNSAGALFGAQLALKLSPNLAVVGNVGYSDPEVRAGVPFLGSVHLGSSKIWLYDAGLQLSLPSGAAAALPIAPYVEGGVGSMRYEVSSGPLSGKATNVAWNVGAGADLTLAPSFAVRLFAKDYIGRFDFKDATGLDVNGETAHHVAFGVGLRLDF